MSSFNESNDAFIFVSNAFKSALVASCCRWMGVLSMFTTSSGEVPEVCSLTFSEQDFFCMNLRIIKRASNEKPNTIKDVILKNRISVKLVICCQNF